MKSLRSLIEKNKKIFIVLAAVGVLYSIWNTFLRDSDQSAFSSEASLVDAASSEQGRAIVATLARLNTLSIDTSVLETNLFNNLQDFSQPLPENLPVSKRNPFTFESPTTNPLTNQDITGSTDSGRQAETAPGIQAEVNQDQRPGSENDAPANPTQAPNQF